MKLKIRELPLKRKLPVRGTKLKKMRGIVFKSLLKKRRKRGDMKLKKRQDMKSRSVLDMKLKKLRKQELRPKLKKPRGRKFWLNRLLNRKDRDWLKMKKDITKSKLNRQEDKKKSLIMKPKQEKLLWQLQLKLLKSITLSTNHVQSKSMQRTKHSQKLRSTNTRQTPHLKFSNQSSRRNY